jgi:hypothetical protein
MKNCHHRRRHCFSSVQRFERLARDVLVVINDNLSEQREE